MSPEHYLKENFREDVPAWLATFGQGSIFNVDDFFGARTVYYPGAGDDGHVVKVFGSSHSAHCFIHADYAMSPEMIESSLSAKGRKFAGYETVARIKLRENDLTPRGWKSHSDASHMQMHQRHFEGLLKAQVESFCFVEILERQPALGEEHGAKRLAILFLGADGHAAYDALFCQPGQRPPFAVLLQDHSFGGNYSPFGAGGIMHSIAARTNRMPEILLTAIDSEPWPGYQDSKDLEPTVGGWANFSRRLFVREA